MTAVAEEGELHELYCTRERCPFCDGQLITCGCQYQVLNLTSEERRIMEEYVDDSIEPLKSLIAGGKMPSKSGDASHFVDVNWKLHRTILS
jgi:hypothetical protein